LLDGGGGGDTKRTQWLCPLFPLIGTAGKLKKKQQHLSRFVSWEIKRGGGGDFLGNAQRGSLRLLYVEQNFQIGETNRRKSLRRGGEVVFLLGRVELGGGSFHLRVKGKLGSRQGRINPFYLRQRKARLGGSVQVVGSNFSGPEGGLNGSRTGGRGDFRKIRGTSRRCLVTVGFLKGYRGSPFNEYVWGVSSKKKRHTYVG